MSEQRNLILAIVISMLILLGSQYFFSSEVPRPDGGETEQQTTGDSVTPQPGARTPEGAPAPGGSDLPRVAPQQSRAAALADAARIRIDTPRVDGSIRVRGARIDDLRLKNYHKTVDPASPEIELLNPRNAPRPYYVEFGWVAAAGGDVALPDQDTVWQADGDVLTPGSPITLTWSNDAGLTFERRIEVDENYLFTVSQTVRNTGGQAVTLYPYGLISRHGTPETEDFYILHEGPLGVFGEELTELDYEDLQDEPSGVIKRNSTGGWLGITDKYWLTALVPDQKAAFEGAFRHRVDQGIDKYQADYLAAPVTIAPGGKATMTDRLFAGAKEVDVIDAYEERYRIQLFDRTIDWGWFYFLTKPIFYAIDFFYNLLGNFGLAIIALTFCIKFLFLPLAWKSYVSMSKMKALQPEMVKLRERHGDDKVRMQQEMMALYKKEKVNPVSGCLPILLQIPVFFALYKVLFVTIEMRHAPFYGWIEDLSARDPTNAFELFGLISWGAPEFLHLGVWPLLMGISMYAQQKINPQPPDPMQARIMMMLPIIFTFFLASFPAGLVIYWTVNNCLSIAQQWFIMRRVNNRRAAAAKPGE
ncbi:membrane protein insertase YidC [Minwuia thermotolerans]|uniref:Membrane protein insertase YidC n=1 Tax=Minwuia thermotolerans TaxID=2056226 RepID=A0A2M9G6M0_9PROT|nr:membrane protein insertase YidC [Minwuia thermotolerans]PJK31368.1 membrane protein insertase YidC [Minwuia thermotolerans]